MLTGAFLSVSEHIVLSKDLARATQAKNEHLVNNINDE